MQTILAKYTLYSLIVSIVLVGSLLTSSARVFADNHKTVENQGIELKVGHLEFPPLYISREGMRPAGELADILFGIVEKAGFKYSYQVYPPTRLYKNMGDGLIDLGTGVKGQALYNNNVLWGKKVLIHIEQRIYTLGDRPIPSSIDGLLGKKVAVKRGYGYGGDYLKLTNGGNSSFVDEVNSLEHSLSMLQNGRVDYVLGYKHTVTKLLEKLQISDISYKTLKKIPVYFVISKHTPNAQQILNTLDDHFVNLLGSGL